MRPRPDRIRLPLVALVAALAASPALADGVTFTDFAADPASGIVFEHVESPRNAILDQLKTEPFQLPDDFPFIPHKPHGAPGVAIFDYDRDGDLDVYVTNSLGGANSLFQNRLADDGEFRFVDVAASAGVDAVDHDSTGVCYGDLDNDGDHDLMVLGAIMPNRLYENAGNGTFADITVQAGVGGGNLSTSSCTIGDVDNDGLLDVAVANTHTDWNDLLGIAVAYDYAEHNQLFRNLGGNVFADVSNAAGFETLAGFPPEEAGSAALTWAVALVDYDLDGDVDFFTFDDQGGVPHPPSQGGVNYGIIHLHRNDGTGTFTDITVDAGLALPGNWMGVSFGDYNCDGHMDFFGSNVGDYPPGNAPPMFPLGVVASRWFLGRADGYFDDPGVGDMVASVFGWGTSSADFDNDGDYDVVYHGSIDIATLVDAGNPGTLLVNQGCTAVYDFHAPAFAGGADHARRVDQGVAAGDLNGDGFVDVVSVANATIPESLPLTPQPTQYGSVFDATAQFLEVFSPIDPSDPSLLEWNGNFVVNGAIAVEINSADTGNGWVELELLGSAGILDDDADDSDSESDSESDSDSDSGFAPLVNRDGIGAVVFFTPDGGPTSMRPTVGGSSYASQDALASSFGLGAAAKGTAEVLWPGGVRNRLYDVGAAERVLVPHVPCGFDAAWPGFDAYESCVEDALEQYEEQGFLTETEVDRLFASAVRAFQETR